MSLKTEATADDPDQGVDVASPFHLPAFRWFFTGRLVSLLGSSMTPVALSLAVLNASNSAGDMGAVLTANTIPLIVFTLAGGVVGDRFSRRLVLLLSNLGAGLTQAVVAFLLISGNYHLGSLIVLEALNGTMAAFTNPALRGIVPDIVPKSQIQRANSVLGSAKNAAKVLGPTVAATMVATTNGGWAISVDAATYFVAVVCMFRLRLTGKTPPRKASVFVALREGWTEFRSRTWVWTIVASFGVANYIQVGIWTVLGPLIAKERIGETSWGMVLSVRAVGILLIAVVMYRITLRHLLPVAQLCASLVGLPLIALGLVANAYWLAATAFLAGLSFGLYSIAWETTLQENIPHNMLSRISSYDNLGSFIGVPAGQLSAAPMASAFGASRVALIGGFLWIALTLCPLAVPSVRGMKHAI
ncbi:MFS transporter [Streptomyces sp. NBC_01622]|uniref:MFS transporter n=1 Tax=Streptomyces sp. NBC_01622 TaxID=2975903 RepID=UPI00386DA7D8|nr:MFS transporter [Streptomyces sp. NBC_01622]